ncbi:hypothetical protein OR571_03410 [Psychrobacillus sp. NEAU-3TGS]|uniref:hypothetical protein n=1 Tax=Psychrobacillus sp. NEAU-3TGS TaxID=2995412 RepID=UPI002495FCE7|nr:hypothetical protein [Psychrobacillus sp. NEAU-3TGS]MDI2586197.1 hypothetical protein [Psychrobacillus sp. NEAU-3TGS]
MDGVSLLGIKKTEKAGGISLNLHLPSSFVFQDDYKSIDLMNKKWMDDDEKWS